MSFENCCDCPHHEVIRDPDPDDSFCRDDQAIVCRLTSNPHKNPSSTHPADWSAYRAVQVAIRPYNIRKESETPSWCPLPARIATQEASKLIAHAGTFDLAARSSP